MRSGWVAGCKQGGGTGPLEGASGGRCSGHTLFGWGTVGVVMCVPVGAVVPPSNHPRDTTGRSFGGAKGEHCAKSW